MLRSRARLRRLLRLLPRFLEMDRERRVHATPRAELLIAGFFSCRAELYPLDVYPRALFLNDLEIEAFLPGLNPGEAERPLTDKILFHERVASGTLALPAPPLAGVIRDGRFVPVGGSPDWGRPKICKPARGAGGRGVHCVRSLEDLPPRGDHVVEERLVAHPYAERIYPDTLNTIRVLSGRLVPEGPVLLLGVAHRFGTSRSTPTDNFKRGGLLARIDPDTGRLSSAIRADSGGTRRFHDEHPETGARIRGLQVPAWTAIERLARASMAALPGLRIVGWDIALTPDGPVVVEGNAVLPNPHLHQMHRPLLLDPHVRDFFHGIGVLSSRRLRAAERAAHRFAPRYADPDRPRSSPPSASGPH